MAKEELSGTLAVILHADVASSTELVQQDKEIAHARMRDAFRRFSNTIESFSGHILELRGDALLAQFERASDAVTAALSFQVDNAYSNTRIKDDIRPTIRVGISMGEVVIADNTVTGPGVVQAQRVEQVAEPGGVCITTAIREALSKRMPFDLENLGDRLLKGFDDPVRVYRVDLIPDHAIPVPPLDKQQKSLSRTQKILAAMFVTVLLIAGGAAYWVNSQTPQEEPADIERMAYPLPDKPSLAVLPFNNLSNDADQEFFADGITEDLITDISKISGLFIIARNSVFTYKGKAVKVRQVAEELGVRYVMEGSVRRAGNQVRVNAQLIDATTGGHIWAERYDGKLDDVFSIQDRITQSIVSALSVVLTNPEQDHLGQGDPVDPQAYDAFLLGWRHFRRNTPKDFSAARDYFEQAITIDPQYSRAYASLAELFMETRAREWTTALGIGPDALRRKATNYLETANAGTTSVGLMTFENSSETWR